MGIGNSGLRQVGCAWPNYLNCWKKNIYRLVGPHGTRSGLHVHLLNPDVVDINYRPWSNEPRYREAYLHLADNLPPIQNTAFLWHYVGIPKKAASLLRDFGLKSIEETLDCQYLRHRFDEYGKVLQFGAVCQLSGSSVACPYYDS